MSITDLLNPYTYIGGAVVLAALGGAFYYQDRQIHHFHTMFDNDHDNVTKLDTKIHQMTQTQNTQTTTTEGNIVKVVTVPGPVKTIVKEIHDAPEPANCGTPALSHGDKNAL